MRSKIKDDKQPRFLVGWALGHKDADTITLMEDGSVRYNGLWKYSADGRNDRVRSRRNLLGMRTWNQRQSWSEAHVRMSTDNYHLLQNNYSFDALQACCVGINFKLTPVISPGGDFLEVI